MGMVGEIQRSNLLNSMEKSISKIYENMLRNKDDWGEEEVRSDLIKSSREFSSFLQRQIANLDSKIVIKVPNPQLTEEDIANFDEILEDKHPEKKKETYFKAVENWINNITEFIDNDTSNTLSARPKVHEGPQEEINRWERRQM